MAIITTVVWLLLELVNIVLCIGYFLALCLQHGRWHVRRRWLDPSAIKKVVVVGSGFGGLEAARHLGKDARLDVTMISQRDFFEYVPGILRLFCDPDMFWGMACALPRGNNDFLLGSVIALDSNSVSVQKLDGSTAAVSFDYLILAMGADYRQPVTASVGDSTMEARSATWAREAEKVEQANSVIVLGGGAVGTELAAEIIDHYPEKAVTLITGAKSLVPSFPEKCIAKAHRWLKNRGVLLVLGERVERFDDRSCTTTSGQSFEADIVFNCFGLKANTKSVSTGSLASALTGKQELQVRETLQLEGFDHIFAVGDVMTLPSGEIKQAFYAQLHGKAAAFNVSRHLSNKELLRYPHDIVGSAQAPLVAILSLGRFSGSLIFNSLVVNGFFAAVMKWFIEWSKVQEMRRRPVGLLLWKIGDEISFLLSRCCIRPPAVE